jgi:hypothetical protein
LRFALSRPNARVPFALLAACLTTSACATRAAAPETPAPATAASAEELRYAARADSLRRWILARTGWAELGQQCNPGMLRVFPDTAAGARASLDTAVMDLERIIIARGVDAPIDVPAGHDLLSTVILWEAAGPRPRWDVSDPKEDRRAIATGLTGQVVDPETMKCISYVHDDSVVIVTPRLTNYETPKAKGAMRVSLYAGGDSALKRARDTFYAIEGHEGNTVFTYTYVGPVVLWRDWGLVVVNRPAEANGVAATGQGTGGAAYLFHRVGREWRLLMISRTWG